MNAEYYYVYEYQLTAVLHKAQLERAEKLQIYYEQIMHFIHEKYL